MAKAKKTKTQKTGKRGPGRPPGSPNKPKGPNAQGTTLSTLGEAAVVSALTNAGAAFEKAMGALAPAPDKIVVVVPAPEKTRVLVGDDKEAEKEARVVLGFGLTADGTVKPLVFEADSRDIIAVPPGMMKSLTVGD